LRQDLNIWAFKIIRHPVVVIVFAFELRPSGQTRSPN